MRSTLSVLLFSFCLLGVLALPVAADPPTTSLRIEVKTLSDKPIERASVIVRFVEGRNIIKLGKEAHMTWQLKTNQDGVAKMPPMPRGKIRIQVIAKGYQTFGQLYEIEEPERTIEIKMNPPQPQVSVHQ